MIRNTIENSLKISQIPRYVIHMLGNNTSSRIPKSHFSFSINNKDKILANNQF